MSADMAALARRIRELRGNRPAAEVARRVGISPAYLSALESFDRPGSKPNKVSVPVVRILADVLGAPRSELLDLAGYHGDAAFDRVDEMRGQEVVVEGPGDAVTMSSLEQSIRELTAALGGLKQQAIPPAGQEDPTPPDEGPAADPPPHPGGRGKASGPSKRRGAAK